MIPPVSLDRWRGEWAILAMLAEWLRDSRADAYPQMVAKGHLTEDEAAADRLARAALAAEWQAIAGDRPLPADAPRATPSIRRWALDQAITGFQLRLKRLAETGGDMADWIEVRDATAALRAYEGASLLGIQSMNREVRLRQTKEAA